MDYAFTNRRWITKEERGTGEEVLNRKGIGFRVSGFWDKVIDLNECHLQAEPSNAIRKVARDYAIENNLEFFDIAEKKGFLRNLIIRMSSTGEIMTLFQFFHEDEKKRESLLPTTLVMFFQKSLLCYIVSIQKVTKLFSI